MTGVTGLVECMRPGQWVKNSFVAAPLIFSGNLADPWLGLRAAAAFGLFCLASSGIYLLNDSLDWRADLEHPEKRSRPIPSGRLSPVIASACGVVSVLMAALGGFLVNGPTGFLLSAYVLLNVIYSTFLKHVMLFDLMCIAVGFVLRVLGGGSAVRVECSHWLLMCTFLLALFLALAKRRHELVTLSEGSGKHRRVLMDYKLPWLDQALTLVSAATAVAYALYTVSPETQARFQTDHLIYTFPFVIFGILRYLHLTHQSEGNGNPSSALLSDRQMLLCVSVWVFSCIVIIYL
jgi:4-hydroxybenzoate polyprenyltransferase